MQMNRNTWAAIGATIAVIAILILGFSFLGTPAQQRLARADGHAVQELATLAENINSAWSKGNVLPASLDNIPGNKNDAVSGKPFLYHPKQSSAYELCATFATDNRKLRDTNTGAFWLHPKGEYCFQLDASQQAPQAPYSYPD